VLIDLKYHLISLVAVFLALAVGILVGSSFVAGTSVKGLEKEFVKLRIQNQQQQNDLEVMRDQVASYEEFGRTVAPILVDGKLAMRRIALIQTGDYSEATQSAKFILEQAGANVASVTTLSNADSPNAQNRIAQAVEQITGETQLKDPAARMIEIVANCIATGANRYALDILEKNDLLTTSGDYDSKALRIVLVGGGRTRASLQTQNADLVLIDKLKAAGVVTIVGVEPSDAVNSYIPVYHRKSIPTVDDIDQPMGQVALVFAVAGETGNFGVKKSADRLMPTSLGIGQ